MVTGAAGFIGYHLSAELLARRHHVLGIDSLNSYYEPALKSDRLDELHRSENFTFRHVDIVDTAALTEIVEDFKPERIFHFAAQAGVRYSIEAPDVYLQSNIIGTHSIITAIRNAPVEHLVFSSTSSVYGGNLELPFTERHTTDAPQSLYAATKRAAESLLHSNSHLRSLPTTVVRFFTVYGPWGRPDMALFKFVRAALCGERIDVYGNGQLARDFTYVHDLVEACVSLGDVIPQKGTSASVHDSISPVAPFRVVNVGGGRPIGLMDFIRAIETELNVEIPKNMLPEQPGDVTSTHADPSLLRDLIGSSPHTTLGVGVANFVKWYREYYDQ
jgi:UDP-glucuronate 4-epimerase